MGLVFAAIAPHGGLAIAELCADEDRELARSFGMLCASYGR